MPHSVEAYAGPVLTYCAAVRLELHNLNPKWPRPLTFRTETGMLVPPAVGNVHANSCFFPTLFELGAHMGQTEWQTDRRTDAQEQ